MNVSFRSWIDHDIPELAAMNHALIRDEGHRSTLSRLQLEERMSRWLEDEYAATIFLADDEIAGYALYSFEPEWTYLRQFFVVPEYRRQAIGRAAIKWLNENDWFGMPRIRLDVLVGNAIGISFWRELGFRDYCITMELDS